MKPLKKLGTVIILICVIVFNVFAQERELTREDAIDESLPSEAHKKLKIFEGSWKQEFNFYGIHPTIPIKSQGKISFETVLGGRYIKGEGETEFFGKKINSIVFIGHNNRTKKYFLTAMDEMETFSINAEGNYSDSLKYFIFEGSYYDQTIKSQIKFRIVYNIENQNKIIFDYYLGYPNIEKKLINVIYTKIKQ